MKKFLALILTLSTVAQVSAGCGSSCQTKVNDCGPAPICSKLITKEIRKPARKFCETNCHYECPADCTRAEVQG